MDAIIGRYKVSMEETGLVLRHPTGLRFSQQRLSEDRPGSVSDTLGQARVFAHVAHRQDFHCQKAKALDELARFLLKEVLAMVPGALMDTRDHFPRLLTFF